MPPREPSGSGPTDPDRTEGEHPAEIRSTTTHDDRDRRGPSRGGARTDEGEAPGVAETVNDTTPTNEPD